MFITGEERNGIITENRSETSKKIMVLAKKDNAEHCVCCGAVVPEGREICPLCEAGRMTGTNLS